eukprot:1545109-Rhodomonas_salina.1
MRFLVFEFGVYALLLPVLPYRMLRSMWTWTHALLACGTTMLYAAISAVRCAVLPCCMLLSLLCDVRYYHAVRCYPYDAAIRPAIPIRTARPYAAIPATRYAIPT